MCHHLLDTLFHTRFLTLLTALCSACRAAEATQGFLPVRSPVWSQAGPAPGRRWHLPHRRRPGRWRCPLGRRRNTPQRTCYFGSIFSSKIFVVAPYFHCSPGFRHRLILRVGSELCLVHTISDLPEQVLIRAGGCRDIVDNKSCHEYCVPQHLRLSSSSDCVSLASLNGIFWPVYE